MKTLRQYCAEQLAEKRALYREGGERMPASDREGYLRIAERDWWALLTAAAWDGDDIPQTVWNAAASVDPAGCARLQVRNRTARSARRTDCEDIESPGWVYNKP